MPNYREETGTLAGDRSWYDSIHGIANSRTEKVDVSTFTRATDFPNGYIPSGTPVAIVGAAGAKKAVKYVPTDETGKEVFAGFLATDQLVYDAAGIINSPIFDHGRVRINRLPVTFAVPAKNASTIIFA